MLHIFFVRLSSNRPLEAFRDTPPVRIFLNRLAAELEQMLHAALDLKSQI